MFSTADPDFAGRAYSRDTEDCALSPVHSCSRATSPHSWPSNLCPDRLANQGATHLWLFMVVCRGLHRYLCMYIVTSDLDDRPHLMCKSSKQWCAKQLWVKKKSKAGSRLGIKFCEGQGSLACYSPWGCKESDMTERLNNHNNNMSEQQNGFSLLLFLASWVEGKRQVLNTLCMQTSTFTQISISEPVSWRTRHTLITPRAPAWAAR